MHPRPAVSPQKLGSHVEQSGPATLGRQSHVPRSGWQRLFLDPVRLHEQSERGEEQKTVYELSRRTVYNDTFYM